MNGLLARLTALIKHPAARLVVTIVLAAGAALAGVELIDEDGDGRTDKVTIRVPGPDIQADPDQTLETQERHASDELSEGIEAHEDARDETPPGVPLEKAREGQAQTRAPGLRAPQPLGGAQNYSCRYRPVVNWSYRSPAGVRVQLLVLHITVSPFGSINGIFNAFNTPSFGASSHLGLEPKTKECQQWVSFDKNAWTEGNFNSRSDSIELVVPRLLTRAEWLALPIIRDGTLAAIIRDRTRARGLPIRLVDPQGCLVQEAGITDHDRLECGNDHVDVGREFPWDVVLRQARIGHFGESGLALLWKGERGNARCLIRERRTWPKAKGRAARRTSIDRAKKCKRALKRSDRHIHRQVHRATGTKARARAWKAHRRGPRHRVIHKVLERKRLR